MNVPHALAKNDSPNSFMHVPILTWGIAAVLRVSVF